MIDKVVDSTVLDGYFEDIADAIRAKGGSGLYTPAQMPQAIEDLPSKDPSFEALLAGRASGSVTISGITDLRNCRICLGNGGSVGGNNVKELHMPDVTILAANNANYMRYSGLVDATGRNSATATASLEVLDIPKCESLYIGDPDNGSGGTNKYIFAKLKTLNAPKLQRIRGAISNCQITELSLPELNETFASMFISVKSMTRAYLPKLGALPVAVFQGCTSLLTVEIGTSTISGTGGTINASALSDTAIDALVVRFSSVKSLGSTAAFTNTPIAAGTGYIYVPRSLISTYEAATNWSTYAGQFRAIEDYTQDGTIDGEFIHP